MALSFKIEIDCDNDAFQQRWKGDSHQAAAADEVARILRDTAKQMHIHGGLPTHPDPLPLYDVNGNKVGQAFFKVE